MNTQPQERKVDSDLLHAHSIFKTIQGEGPFQGEPAIFVRLTGCNLQCPNCDTDYTSIRTGMYAKEIFQQIEALKSSYKQLVVITGGEPFRQNILPLLKLLSKNYGYYTQIETNGTIEPSKIGYNTLGTKRGISIVVSPKTPVINENIRRLACAFKYIINSNHIDQHDGLPTRVLGYECRVARPHSFDPGFRRVYVLPEDCDDFEQNKSNEITAIQSSIVYGYNFQMQLHKLIGVP